MVYFESQGPLLVMCPEVFSSLKLTKHLFKNRTLTMSIDKEGVGHLDNSTKYDSTIICVTTTSNMDIFVNILTSNSGCSNLFRKRWIVLCDNKTCAHLISLKLVNIGNNMLLVNINTRLVTETYVINGLIQTHLLGKMRETSSFRKDQLVSINEQRSNLQGAELVTLVESQHPHIIFHKSYSSKSRLATSNSCSLR